MTATLDQIEDALWARLAGLLGGYTPGPSTAGQAEILAPGAPSGTQPFRYLKRFAGEVVAAWAEEVARGTELLAPTQRPAAFLAFEGCQPLGADAVWAETGGHESQVVVRSLWRVYVVVGDLRSDAAATKASIAGQPAVLSALQRVMEQLDGLAVDGLHDDRPVRWVGSAPWLIAKRTTYVYVARFRADAALPESSSGDLAPPGAPLGGMRGTVEDVSPDSNGGTVTLSTFDETL